MNLASLDEARPCPADPRVWSENLAAVHDRQPRVAERLAEVLIPETWRVVQALDGSITYRLESPGQPPEWLAGVAAPATRAAALVGSWRHADRNVALTTIAAGAEATLLLAQLPQHVAVFVFEDSWERLAAVLRAKSFADDLGSGRLWLLPPGDERGELARVLAAEAGLLPPAALLGPDLVPGERLAYLKSLCEELTREILVARQAEIDELARMHTAAAPVSRPGRVTLAVISATQDEVAQAAGAALVSAAQQCGWSAEHYAAQYPTDVHLLRLARALAARPPELTLLLNPGMIGLPGTLLGRAVGWYLDVACVPEVLPAEATLLAAGSPVIAERLRSAASKGVSLLDCYCGVAAEPSPSSGVAGEIGWPVDAAANTGIDGLVVFVADRPAADAQACGIEQPTHRILWERLREVVVAEWDQPRPLRGAALLARLERELGLALGSAALEAHFVRMLEAALIPAVTVERILHELSASSTRVLLIGRGWTAPLPEGARVAASGWFAWRREVQACVPCAIVMAGRADPLTSGLLDAGLMGVPLLLHAPGGQPLGPLLGQILHPGQHFEPFSDGRELRRALAVARERPAALQRQVARTRAHLLGAHTWRHRLERLASACGLAVTREAPDEPIP